MAEAWAEARKRRQESKHTSTFAKYADNPVGFGMEVLGDRYTDDVKRMMESVRDNPITIARSGNAVGKSFGAARVAVWFYKAFPQSKVYLTAAPPLDNLKRILWGEIMSIVSKRPDLFRNDNMRSLSMFRNSKSFINGVAIPTSGSSEEREAKFSGKHAPNILFIVDEGDAVPEEVYRGIESCMSGGMARLLITFNPRAQLGPVYQKEYNKQANVVHLSALNHPNVLTGENVIPGAVDREITVRRIQEWTRPYGHGEAVGADSFSVPSFLVGYQAESTSGEYYPPLEAGLRKIIEPSFSYMVLGEYPHQSETQLISTAWIEAAVERWILHTSLAGEQPPDSIRPIMGLDSAEFGHDSNIACMRYEHYVPRLIAWQGLDPDATSLHAINIYRQYNAQIVMVDGTGVGASIAPSMARRGRDIDLRAVNVKVSSRPSNMIKSDIGEFRTLRDQLWWACREWLRTNPYAMIPPDQLLIAELKTPTYRVTHRGIEISSKDVMRSQLKRSPDRADALCLTFTPVARPTTIRLVE